LGEHLRKRRIDLGLTQKEAAQRIGADQWTVINWEQGRTKPAVRFVPRILAFLGFDPQKTGRELRSASQTDMPKA
jgi:DNA-binding XRE family transcriptional regulator